MVHVGWLGLVGHPEIMVVVALWVQGASETIDVQLRLAQPGQECRELSPYNVPLPRRLSLILAGNRTRLLGFLLRSRILA